jgi:hypothetical protein
MSLVGLLIILSTVAGLCAFISPDSVNGNFKKCTIIYWNAKGEDKENSTFVITEALYNPNGKIITEVSKYQDGTSKQSMNYMYDLKGNVEQFSVFDNKGILSVKKTFKRSNDTLEDKLYKYRKGVEEKIWETNIIIEPNKQLEHSTMEDNGEDGINYMTFSLSQDDSKTISIKDCLPKLYRPLDNKNFPKYEYQYDAAGRINETLQTDPDGEKTTTYNKYDDKGRLIETSVLEADGSKKIESYVKFESNGSKTEFGNNIYGTFYLRFITRYDEKGRIFEKVELHPSGEQRSIVSRKFDDKNRIIEINQKNPDDLTIGKRTFEYDEFGNIIKNVVYSPDNLVVKLIEYAYSK